VACSGRRWCCTERLVMAAPCTSPTSRSPHCSGALERFNQCHPHRRARAARYGRRSIAKCHELRGVVVGRYKGVLFDESRTGTRSIWLMQLRP